MANLVKLNVGTTLTWKDSGGDYVITASSLAAITGRGGAVGDLGAWPHARRFRWYLETAWVANPTAGQGLELWFALWDNDTGPAMPWGQVSAADAAVTLAQLQNCMPAGQVIAEAAATSLYSSGGVVDLPARYVTPILYNNSTTKALAAVGTTPTILRLTPIMDEIQ